MFLSQAEWLVSGETEKSRAYARRSIGQWIDKVHGRRPPKGVVLDMDSSVSPTRGEQEMSVWSGHYECTCYHPLFVFNLFGDLERCALPGNVHGADGWESVLKPVVARYRGKLSRIYFRADARPARDVSTSHGGISTTFQSCQSLAMGPNKAIIWRMSVKDAGLSNALRATMWTTPAWTVIFACGK